MASAAAGASRLVRAKQSTELTGLPVHPTPLTALDSSYQKTLSFLDTLPSESVYRQATHALTTARYDALRQVQQRNSEALQSADAEKHELVIKKLEDAIDAGQIEEVVLQADDELKLAAKMLEWRS